MKLFLVVSCIALATLAGQAQAQNSSPDTTSWVMASAQGEVTLPPDRVVLLIDVTSREASATAATTRNSALVKRVVDTLMTLRGPDDTVGLTGIDVREAEDPQSRKRNGYEAAATVRVVLRRLDQMGRVLDAAFATGATGVNNATFHSDREEAALEDALKRAYARAESQARAMASAAGRRLGELVRLSTSPGAGTSYVAYLQGGIVTSGYSSTPYSPQDIHVTATVYGTWRLGPR